VAERATLDVALAASSPDGHGVTFSVSGLPPFATLTQQGGPNATGTLHVAPGVHARGDYTITVTATDDGGGDPAQARSSSATFVLSVTSFTEAPELDLPREVVAVPGQLLRLPITARDLDQDGLTFAAQGLPAGARIVTDGVYGHAWLEWTPPAGTSPGAYDVSVSVTDSGLPPQNTPLPVDYVPVPNVAARDLRIVLKAANGAPEILQVQADGQPLAPASTVDVAGAEGRPLTLALQARDADGDYLHWVVDDLPPGMTMTPSGGANGQAALTLAWTPGAFASGAGSAGQPAGVYLVTARARDGMAEVAQTLRITVAHVDRAPLIQPLPLQLVNEGSTLGFSLISTDADGDPLRLSLIADDTTPAGVHFDPATGYFEWTPPADTVTVLGATDAMFSFRFAVSDGQLTTTQTVRVKVLHVDRPPVVQASSHALQVGQAFALPVVRGAAAGGGIAARDLDGADQTAALALAFDNLPPGAVYDAAAGVLRWTPGPGQVGDYLVTVRATGVFGTTASSTFMLRVVADPAANAPQIAIDATPSMAVLPGQAVLTSVRAATFGQLAGLTVEVQGAAVGASDWTPVQLNGAGQVRLTPVAPGIVTVRVTARDADGFSATRTATILVRDPAANATPQLSWAGALQGLWGADGSALAPVTIDHAVTLQGRIADAQLMGWQLQIAPAGSGNWTTLASEQDAAAALSGLRDLGTLDPARFANGVYRLRLTAHNLRGGASEIDSRVVIDSTAKQLTTDVASDGAFVLAGHALALGRTFPGGGDFGNWSLPLLASSATSDQPDVDANGAAVAWRSGARVWLQVPSSLSAAAAPAYLAFTLGTTAESLGTAPGAPRVLHPQFDTQDGWTLRAVNLDAAGNVLAGPVALQQQGGSLYDEVTGLPWRPQGYLLTGPDGASYVLDAAGRITAVRFADGARWLVSDAGVAAVGGGRVDFLRDANGRIVAVTGPQADGTSASVVYQYDAAGRLALARPLNAAAGAGTPYGYDAAGGVIAGADVDLGEAAAWTAAGQGGSWSGTLQAGTPVGFGLLVRDSELAATTRIPGAAGAVLLAVRTRGAGLQLDAAGAAVVGSATSGDATVTLLRVDAAGLKRLNLRGTGAASLTVSVAGDLNGDGRIDGTDAAAFDAALGQGDLAADLDGDGRVADADRQILYANYGWRANLAPQAVPHAGPVLLTHTGLSGSVSLDALARDNEGDRITWRVLGATGGQAAIAPDGRSLVFTPAPGFTGTAGVTLVADDGYAVGAPLDVAVQVSDARLSALHVERLAALGTGSAARLRITGDFADQQGVELDAGYVTIVSSDPDVVAVGADNVLRAVGAGTALLQVSAHGLSAWNAVTAGPVAMAPAGSVEFDLYPKAIGLAADGGQRQLDVHTNGGTDIGAASTGTRYFISDPAVATITADGLVIGKSAGRATITVVNGGLQRTVEVVVRAAVTGPTVASAGEGGVTRDADGNTLMVAPGALKGDTTIAVRSLDLNSLDIPTPAAGLLNALGGVAISLSGQQSGLPLQLAVKVAGPADPVTGAPTTLAAGTQVMFWREGTITDADGVVHKTWWLLDNGVIGEDGLAHTASTPYTGITAGGNVIVTGSAKVDNRTGATEIRGAMIDFNAIWSQMMFCAMAPTPMMAVAAMGIFASMSNVVGIHYSLQGSYQLAIPPAALQPNATVSVPVPPNPSPLVPTVTSLSYDAGTRELTVAGVNFVPAGQPAGATKLRVWLVPLGDQLSKPTAAGAAPDRGLVWQPFTPTVAGDGTLKITLPAGVALSQHLVYVERVGMGADPNGGAGQDEDVTVRGPGVDITPLALEQAQMELALAKQLWIDDGVDPSRFDGVELAIGTLPGNRAADTSGKTITLSADAAGWGWLVDQDPLAMNGWDSTALPEVFQAASGSAADGKLDLLTVLLHELGHLLNLQDNQDPGSVMDGAIDPGVRRLPLLDDIPDGGTPDLAADAMETGEVIGGVPVGLSFSQPPTDVLVTSAHRIDVFASGAGGPALAKQITTDEKGQPLDMIGGPDHQIAYNEEGSLAFIAGRNGRIYVLDTTTRDIVWTIEVANETSGINSLVVNNGWLYVTEGNHYGASGGRLLRIDCDSTSPNFLKRQQVVKLPTGSAPYGYLGMAVNSGRYLAVAAPQTSLPLSNTPRAARGNVYIIDTYGIDGDGTVAASDVVTVDLSGYTAANGGKGPQYITDGGAPGRFLLSNAKDYDRGVAAVTFDFDQSDGLLAGTTHVSQPLLTPGTNYNWLQAHDQQNIQRAAGAVVLQYQGETYALVADYNFLFDDAHFNEWDNFGLGKQIGGKIGVIKDPFGVHGAPVYMGATTPIPGVALDKMALGADGNIYVNGFVEDESGHYGYSDMMYQSLFVWNAGALVQAAINAQGRPLTTPIDRTSQTSPVQLVAPLRFDSDGSNGGAQPNFGWIYGIASYMPPSYLAEIPLQNVPYLADLMPGIAQPAPTPSAGGAAPAPAVPVKDTSNGTVNTGLIRLGAELSYLWNGLSASTRSLFGYDNTAQRDAMVDARHVLDTVDYNIQGAHGAARVFADVAKGLDGLVMGITEIPMQVADTAFVAAGFAKGVITGNPPDLQAMSQLGQAVNAGASGEEVAGMIARQVMYVNPWIGAGAMAVDVAQPLLKGDYAGAFDQGIQSLAMLAAPAIGGKVSRTLTRELQTRVKTLAMREQRLTQGRFEQSTGDAMVNGYKRTLTEVESTLSPDALSDAAPQLRLDPNTQCFVAGTLVVTQEGPKPIEHIEVGDRVAARAMGGAENSWRRVLQLFRDADRVIYRITVRTADGRSDTIGTTREHPFFIDGQWWRGAADLRVGDRIALVDGGVAEVTATAIDAAHADVYNFEVADVHNYFVGPFGVWVHNKCIFATIADAVKRDVKLTELAPGDRISLLDGPLDVEWNSELYQSKGQLRTEVGAYGEAIAERALYEATGITFEKLQNSRNQGIDLIGFDQGPPPAVIVVEVKAAGEAATPQNPSAATLNAKVRKWLSDAKSGKIAGIEMTPVQKRRFKEISKLINENGGNAAVRPMLMQIKLPIPGKIGPGAPSNEGRAAGPASIVLTNKQLPTPTSTMPLRVATTGPGAAALTMSDLNAALGAAEGYWFAAGAPQDAFASVRFAIDTLPQGMAGATSGNTVLLSSDAAGWGWQTDAGPASGAWYLPTSTPNVSVAADGTPAAGRVDLLTVLVHELGHVLGLADDNSPFDAEAGLLAPGTRRIPGAADVAALAAAAGAAPAPASVVVIPGSASGATIDLAAVAAGVQYEMVIAPTLTDGGFDAGLDAWTAAGNVSVGADHAAVLANDRAADAQLSQVFELHDGDRYLAFTVDAHGLQANDGSAPPDAFEVALDDAGTGAALAGTDGLSESDALLNIQSDGTERMASALTRVAHADGSVTYYVDLQAALAGRSAAAVPAALSFDLIGFNGSHSQVRISDVQLVRDPLAFDDTVVTNEEQSVVVAPLANDLAGGGTPVLEVVDGPVHGRLDTNADGTLTYVPDALYRGADSFSYRYSVDGRTSNVATVGLTMLPVNHVPTGTDSAGQVTAGQPLVLDLAATAVDVDGDPLVAVIDTPPAHGTLSANADGTWTYVADEWYAGDDAVVYHVSDGSADSAPITFNVAVAAAHHAPVAQDGTVQVQENGSIVLDFGTYGYDADGNPMHAVVTTAPQHGTLTARADGSFLYVPDTNYFGTDSVHFHLDDGYLPSDEATLTIEIAKVEIAPTLQDAALTLDENTSVRIDPLAGAYSANHDPLTAVLVTPPAHGRIDVNADGSWTYVPDAYFYGTDSIAWQVTDGVAASSVATAALTVAKVEIAPILADSSAALDENAALVLDPLAAATDLNHDPLTAAIVAQPAHGTLAVNADGTWTYTPAPYFYGADSFTYRVSDGVLASNVATVTLTVDKVEIPPTLADRTVTLDENGNVVLDPLAAATSPNHDPLTALLVAPPAHGSLTFNADGSWSYVPDPYFYGTDTFSYRVTDGVAASNLATVTLAVDKVEIAPVLGDAAYALDEDGSLRLDPLATGYSANRDPLVAQLATGPAHGTLAVEADGTWTYRPAEGFFGTDSFTYRVSDGVAASNLATVTLTVRHVNHLPTLADGSYTLFEDGSVAMDLLAGAQDRDRDPLAVVFGAAPAHGSVTRGADGLWTYVPAAGYSGADQFTYQVSDGTGLSNVATVQLTVVAVNHAPTAAGSLVTGSEDTPLVLRWSDFGAADRDGDALSVTVAALPADGELQRRLDDGSWRAVAVGETFARADVDAGALRFVPAADASGGAGYTLDGYGDQRRHYARLAFTVSDGRLQSAGAAVVIDVAAVADTPDLQLLGGSVTRRMFGTSWEAAANVDSQSTLVDGPAFDGWTLVTAGNRMFGGQNGFEVWHDGDQMADVWGNLRTVHAAAGDGSNWLELNDSAGSQYQTLGISRDVDTDKGAFYNLSFDLAGRPGFSSNVTRVAVYVDGREVAAYAPTSGTTALNWQHANISFTGSGGRQNIRIVTEAPCLDRDGRGTMLDNVTLAETLELDHGVQGGTVALQGIDAALADVDGSESLRLSLAGLPAGSVLSDGVRSAVVAEGGPVDLTGWNTCALAWTPPAGFSGSLALQVTATATEGAGGSTASVTRALAVQVDAVAQPPQLALTPPAAPVSHRVVDTDWDLGCYDWSGSNADYVRTCELEGWHLTPATSSRIQAFPIWQDGDLMTNALGRKVTVQGPAAGSCEDDWLGLTNGVGGYVQANGITRGIRTVDGAAYTFDFNYAGALGLAAANTAIEVLLDGQPVGSYANTSSNTALAWQHLSFGFRGDGQAHSLTIRLSGGSADVAAGAMLQGLQVVETLPRSAGTVYGFAGRPIALPGIAASEAEGDAGTLGVRVAGIPAGAVLSDGTHRVTAWYGATTVDVSGWNLARLTITLADQCWDDDADDAVTLTVRATSTDAANGTSATTERKVVVRTLSGSACANPVGANPYVDLAGSAAVTSTATAAPTFVASGLVAATGSYAFGVPSALLAPSLHADPADSGATMEAWLQSLGAALDKSFLEEMEQALGN
jgi:hypothetical protein